MTAPTPLPGPPVIELRAAGVRFGEVQALQPLDLTLRRGERLALIGANGCGKTTLLRLLHGLLPGSGERRVHPIDGRAPVQAMLFQRPFLLQLSVALNLKLALWLARVPRREWPQRLAEALQRVGLQGLEGRPARALSGGQQQRLALARAWMLRPDILFLDEPTASLDPGSKREVEALIAAFAADGVTLVMSSHNLGQVKRLATRVIYLEAGRQVVDLPVDRFFHAELPTEAAQFLRGELPWH
ncbi:MAG: ATP-binding cassette domain-containing protein [Burkholderiaceae bacterium]|nr:ATP-binding cassette domain-containing protein [Burkholderiaceae bacterium]